MAAKPDEEQVEEDATELRFGKGEKIVYYICQYKVTIQCSIYLSSIASIAVFN